MPSTKRKKHTRVFIWVSLSILLLDGLFVGLNYVLSRQTLDEELSKETATLHKVFQAALNDTEKNLLLTTSIFANDTQVQHLFWLAKHAVEREGGGAGGEEAARLRQQLYDLVSPRWHQAMNQFAARQLHFHLGPGSLSFLRVHRPTKFGDRMDDVRFTVVDTNADQKPRTGFETGRVYSGIRGVLPVFYTPPGGQREYVGALETGVSFQNVISSFSQATGTDISILLSREHTESAMWQHAIKKRFGEQNTICGCVIESTSSTYLENILNEIYRQVADKSTQQIVKNGLVRIVEAHEHYFSTAFFKLRDYRGLHDESRPDAGAILLWNNIDDRMAAFYRNQLLNLAYAGLAFLVVEFLLFIGFVKVTRRLEQEIQYQTQALSEREQRLRQLLDSTPDPIVIADSAGVINMVNHLALKLFGYTREELLGQQIEILLPQRFRQQHPSFRHLFVAQSDSDFFDLIKTFTGRELLGQTKAGVEIPLEITLNKIPTNDGLLVAAAMHDISARKQREQELKRSREQAEQANRAKSIFLANMSHELRTPLNAVLGFAQVLNNDKTLSKAQKDFVQSIYRGGHYLLTLINDILDLAKIEAGRFELFPRSFKTGLFFDDLVNMLKIRAKKKGLEFICHIHPNIPAMLHGDDKRLRQIILNLAGNAIKFTEQGEVKVSLEFVRDTLHIDISDTGAGIAAADLASIFQPFTQVGDVQHKQQGTGLGLSITQRLVKTMGGDIRVDSQVGQGSCFHVEIPLEVVNTVTEALEFETGMYHVTGYQRVSGDGALQILIVDDVAENRQIMRALLEPVGFETTEADSGEQCLDLLEHIQPDAVLMDLRMPGLDGLETTRRLRQLPGLSELPVIAITAAAFEDDRTASLAAGCDAHIAKPLRQSELFDSLARVLPITWMYEVLEQTSEDIDNLRHEALSEEQFETLSKLLKKGDISNLIKFAAELENSHCDQALSKQINTLIRQFNFKGLQRLLANLRDDSSS